MATTLLVTVGSTQFQQLTDAVLAPAVLDALPQLGVSELIVQLGGAQLPAAVQLQLSSAGEGAFTHGGDGNKLRVDVLRYTKGAREMDALIARAGVVVSHAGGCPQAAASLTWVWSIQQLTIPDSGSGTILEVLRKSPPPRLLVVPNPALMDDHQRELADALAAGKYLAVSDVE